MVYLAGNRKSADEVKARLKHKKSYFSSSQRLVDAIVGILKYYETIVDSMKKIIFPFFTLLIITAHAQKEVPLYDGPIVNAHPCNIKETWPAKGRIANVVEPNLAVFLPEISDSMKTAILIFPGGGYTRLSMDHEGYDVAKEFNKHGVAAFVVKYRLPNDSCMESKELGPLQDAEQAIKKVREHAKEWNLDTSKIGIIGFSAGGHLAASLGTQFSRVLIENKNNTILRPDFMVLGYPVISFSDSLMHPGSRANLIGKTPTIEKIKAWSNELLVSPMTPPSFLIHAADDRTVNVQNSIVFYQALLVNKVPSEMHIYPKGGHGFGMNNATTTDKWFPQVIHWMMAGKWMTGNVE